MYTQRDEYVVRRLAFAAPPPWYGLKRRGCSAPASTLSQPWVYSHHGMAAEEFLIHVEVDREYIRVLSKIIFCLLQGGCTLRVFLLALVMGPLYSRGVCSMGPHFLYGI